MGDKTIIPSAWHIGRARRIASGLTQTQKLRMLSATNGAMPVDTNRRVVRALARLGLVCGGGRLTAQGEAVRQAIQEGNFT